MLKQILQWVFPPVCASCEEETVGDSYFCPACWLECEAVDPAGRCSHCFEEGEGTCRRCRKNPLVAYVRASVFQEVRSAHVLARTKPECLPAFAVRQWARLAWEMPDVVVPLKGAKAFGLEFAERIGRPFAQIVRRRHCNVEAIEEGLVILLLDTVGDARGAKRTMGQLREASPKKGYLLSLFPI